MIRLRHVGFIILTAMLSFGMLGAASADHPQISNNPGEADASLGMEISAFMQAGAAETNSSIENGMWAAGNPGGQDLDRRTHVLTLRLQQIDQELSELDGENMTAAEHNAKSSRLLGQFLGLKTAIGSLENAANQSEHEPPGLMMLRERSNETAFEFVGVARGVPGGVPPGLQNQRGPPDDRDIGPPDIELGNETALGVTNSSN